MEKIGEENVVVEIGESKFEKEKENTSKGVKQKISRFLDVSIETENMFGKSDERHVIKKTIKNREQQK